jgi:hypothetical protein
VTPYVFAFDPGLTTGWAVMHTERETVVSGESNFDDFCMMADAWLGWWGPAASIVGERFIINVQTAKHTQAPWSLEVIGVMRYLNRKHGCAEFVLQNPSDAKRLVSNDHIRDLGWWTKGTAGHDKDALRHLAMYALKQGWRHPAFIPR